MGQQGGETAAKAWPTAHFWLNLLQHFVEEGGHVSRSKPIELLGLYSGTFGHNRALADELRGKGNAARKRAKAADKKKSNAHGGLDGDEVTRTQRAYNQYYVKLIHRAGCTYHSKLGSIITEALSPSRSNPSSDRN